MDGGKDPLRDGDWAVMRVARSMPASAVENRVVLVETRDDSFGAQYQIKRLRRRGSGWLLASDNAAGPTIEATEGMVPIARLERAIRPESLAPAVGTVLEEHEIAAGFGLEAVAPRSDRHGGHLFIFVDRKGMLEAPDRLRFLGVTPRAAETAFVLIARQGAWRYAGVARQTGERGVWSLPEVDFASWRAWGEGREVSRRIRDGASRGTTDRRWGGGLRRADGLVAGSRVGDRRGRGRRGAGWSARRGARESPALSRGNAEGLDPVDRHGMGDCGVEAGQGRGADGGCLER
jgi:hypothetical protein